MANWRVRWAGLLLFLAGGLVVSYLGQRLLKRELEREIREGFSSTGWELREGGIDTIGMGGISLNPGWVYGEGTVIGWERAGARWHIADLINAELRSLRVNGPRIEVAFNVPLPPEPEELELEPPPVAVAAEREQGENLEEPEPVETDSPEELGPRPGGEDGTSEVPADEDEDLEGEKATVTETPATEPNPQEIVVEATRKSWVERLQVAVAEFESGRLRVNWIGMGVSDFDWSFSGYREEWGVGHFSLNGDGVAANVTLKELPASAFSANLDLRWEDGAFMDTIFRMAQPYIGKDLEIQPGSVQLDGVADFSFEEGSLRMERSSSQLEFNDFGLLMEGFDPIRIQNSFTAITVQFGLMTAEGGFRIGGGALGENFEWENFGIRFGVRGFNWRAESEKINFSGKNYSGVAAARGNGLAADRARATFGFENVRLGDLQIEPFGIELDWEGGRRELGFSAAAIGVQARQMYWLEDLSGTLSPFRQEAHVHIFDGFGTSVGHLRYAAAAGLSRVVWTDGENEELGRFSMMTSEGGSISRIEAEGLLDQQWIAFAGNMAGGVELPVLESGRLFLKGNVSFRGLPKGDGELRLEDGRLQFGDDGTATGVNARFEWEMLGAPRTRGAPFIRIEEINVGDFQLGQVKVGLDMPGLGLYRLRTAEARALGGILRVEPFLYFERNGEPLVTKLNFLGLDGAALLELIGEDRLELEGRLNGFLPIGYHQGRFLVGTGELKMIEGGTGRLRFRDPQMLESLVGLDLANLGLGESLSSALSEAGLAVSGLQVELFPEWSGNDLLIRIRIEGEIRTQRIIIPIGGFTINNTISPQDLHSVLNLWEGMQAEVRPGFGVNGR